MAPTLLFPSPASDAATSETRRAIVDAAMALLSNHGPAGRWTVLDVCRRAQVSRATFYIYFEGREHLVSECVRTIMKRCSDAVSQIKTTDIFESMLEFASLLRPGSGSLDENRRWGLIEILETVQTSEDLRADYVELVMDLREKVIERVVACQAAGTIDPSLDPQGVGGLLNAVLFSGLLFTQLGVPLRPMQVFEVLKTVLGAASVTATARPRRIDAA